MTETYWRRVSAWVADHLTDAFMIGGGLVFYGGMFYRPLAVAWAVANVLLALVVSWPFSGRLSLSSSAGRAGMAISCHRT
jgi:hypothetical protein